MTSKIETIFEELKSKKPVIIFDYDNENEGDLIYPSELINSDILNFMLNNCKGVICQTLPEEIINKLEIPVFKKKAFYYFFTFYIFYINHNIKFFSIN